jgi:mRNA interferase MazF
VVTSSAGAVVLVRFPFSDLSQTRLRPAVVLADAGRGDWILCQVTSNAYADPQAVEIVNRDFQTGSLNVTSYVRPGKIFTAHESLVVSQVGTLTDNAFKRVAGAVIGLLQASLPP